MSFNKLLAGMVCCTLLACMVSGCNSESSQEPDSENSKTESTVSFPDTSSMFTNRDTDASYDSETAVRITLADGASSCNSSSVKITDDTIRITDAGTYLLSGSLSNGQLIIDADDQKVQLVLDNVNINCDTSAAIYARKSDKLFLTLADGSTNTLTNKKDFVPIDDNNIDSVIFSKDDLTLNGSGTLTINAAYGHGIVSKDDLVITDGIFHITAQKHALSGKDSVRIADGSFELTTGSDGIHSENIDEDDKGFIYVADGVIKITCDSDGLDSEYSTQIDGGNIQISAGDDGIHSDGDLVIRDGTINIDKSYEGLEGMTITIDGGTINVTASDDGLNAAGDGTSSTDTRDFPQQNPEPKPFSDSSKNHDMPSDKKFEDNSPMVRGEKAGAPDQANDSNFILINAGSLIVNAEGDGIDSNGNLSVTGGEVYVYGPTNNGNGALDYAGTAVISGGTVVAVGSNGMAQNFGTDSTQGSMLVSIGETMQEGKLTLTDSDGNVILSCTPVKSYNSVLISCPSLSKGESYTLTSGTASTTVEMSSLIYGTEEQHGGKAGGRTGNRPF